MIKTDYEYKLLKHNILDMSLTLQEKNSPKTPLDYSTARPRKW